MENSKCVIEGEPSGFRIRLYGGMWKVERVAPIEANETLTVLVDSTTGFPIRALEPSEETIVDRMRRSWQFRDAVAFEACVKELESQ